MLSSVKAIYFDLDDTLCGYWDASKAALRKTFDEHKPGGLSVDEIVEHWAAAFREFAPSLKKTGWYDQYLKSGAPTRTEQMRLMLDRIGIQDPELAYNLSQSYMEHRDQHLELFEDALEVLEYLKPKYPLGLITNGPADIQRQEIATLGIGHFFDHIFIEGEMLEGKPLVTVFERAQAAMGVETDQLLMVGNSFGHDIKPAIELGWQTAWIRRPSDIPPSAKEMETLPADGPVPVITITELKQLIPLL